MAEDDIFNIYDEIEIDDLEFVEEMEEDGETIKNIFFYPCPCGDKFRITLDQLKKGEKIAECPSCSLKIEIIFENDELSSHMTDLGYASLVEAM